MSQNYREVIEELKLEELSSQTIEIEISKVFSINNRWIPGVAYKGSKPYGYLRLHEEAAQLVEEVKDKIEKFFPKISYKIATKATIISATIALPADKILLKEGKDLRKVDLSNMWPVIENGIAAGLGLDDSLTCRLILDKTISKDEKYYLKLKVTTYGV